MQQFYAYPKNADINGMKRHLKLLKHEEIYFPGAHREVGLTRMVPILGDPDRKLQRHQGQRGQDPGDT